MKPYRPVVIASFIVLLLLAILKREKLLYYRFISALDCSRRRILGIQTKKKFHKNPAAGADAADNNPSTANGNTDI